MKTRDWFRLILKEFSRGRKTVYIPTDEPRKMRERLRYYKRKQAAQMRFVISTGALMVIKI